MYLHIGNDKIIKKQDILFILDYEGLSKNINFKNFIEKIDIIKDNNQNIKTIIITKEKEKIKGYLSNISSNTIGKRNKF